MLLRAEFPVVKFKNIRNQVAAPFVFYTDFESVLKILSDCNKYQEHIACSYAYQIVSNIPGVEFAPWLYVGEYAANHFLVSLQDDLNKFIIPIIEKDVNMIWNNEAIERFQSAIHCHLCEKELDQSNDVIVRDHCHFTRQFHGTAHEHCNLQYKINKSRYKLPVVFHNLRGYDSYMIFQEVQRKHGKIDVIPNNSEHYISFTIGCLKLKTLCSSYQQVWIN